jgi:hypothetical protein
VIEKISSANTPVVVLDLIFKLTGTALTAGGVFPAGFHLVGSLLKLNVENKQKKN